MSNSIFIKEDSESPQFVSADPDCRLGPTVTSTDYWEYMYRIERKKRRNALKKCGLECSDDEGEVAKIDAIIEQTLPEDNAGKDRAVEQKERERRDSIKLERGRSMSGVDDFAEWNVVAVANDSPFSTNNTILSCTEVAATPLKMIEIDGSDDDEATDDSGKWWKGASFKSELRTRTHTEITEVIRFYLT